MTTLLLHIFQCQHSCGHARFLIGHKPPLGVRVKDVCMLGDTTVIHEDGQMMEGRKDGRTETTDYSRRAGVFGICSDVSAVTTYVFLRI